MGGQAVANYDSVASWKGGENIIKTAIDAFGKLDILVNNAGILRDKMLFNMTEEEWDIVVKIHLYGHFYTTRQAAPLFRQQRSGVIINTSSGAGLGGTFGQANYGAAKEGIVGFTRKVAQDLGRYGIRCNAIRPNAGTRLTLSDDMRRTWPKDKIEAFEKSFRPEDIAPLVTWLVSDAATNVNGRTFFVQTGVVALYSEPEMEKQILKLGGWTIDELFKYMPTTLAAGLVNIYPPAPVEKK